MTGDLPPADRDAPLWYRQTRFRWGAGVALLLLVALFLLWPDSPAARLLRQDTTWRTIQQRGTWRVGLDPSFPPFESLDAEGTPVGYDVDLARAIAAEWGVEVELVAVGFDSLQDALMAGRIDSVVSALPYDPRLTKDIAYSTPYFDAGLRLAAPSGSPLAAAETAEIEELNGHILAVEWGSNGDMFARQFLREGGDFELVSFPTPQDAINAVERDRAHAVLVDYVTLREAQGTGSPVVPVGPPLESIPYAIAMPVDAHELQRAVDTALTNLQNNGMMTTLETMWFGPAPDTVAPDTVAPALETTVTTE